MIAAQLAAKESRLVQELVTMKIVLPVLGLKTDRVATNHVKSVCLNPYWQIVEFFHKIGVRLRRFCGNFFHTFAKNSISGMIKISTNPPESKPGVFGVIHFGGKYFNHVTSLV